jgi:hypothetical protein
VLHRAAHRALRVPSAARSPGRPARPFLTDRSGTAHAPAAQGMTARPACVAGCGKPFPRPPAAVGVRERRKHGTIRADS